jgi:hypothetical protein
MLAKSFSVLFFYLSLLFYYFLLCLSPGGRSFSFVFICTFSKVDIHRTNPIILYYVPLYNSLKQNDPLVVNYVITQVF